MKKIILLVSISFVFSNLSYASKSERVDARKTHVLTHIDQKISLLNSHRSCVSSAKDKSGMQNCMESHKSKMKAHQTNKKASKSAMKAKYKAKKKSKI